MGKILRSFLATILISQIGFAPLFAGRQAQAQTNHSDDGPDYSEFSDGERTPLDATEIAEAAELRAVIEGRSGRVRNRLDTFGLYDLVSNQNSRQSKIRIDVSKLTVGERPGGLFEILFQGEKLFWSRFPVRSIAHFEDYLVFIEENSFNKVQHLSFIDLKKYLNVLGNQGETPPIFSVPIALKSHAQEISVAADGVVVTSEDGSQTNIHRKGFEGWSDLYEMTMNVTANMLNPTTYETLGPVVEELETYYLRAADHAAMEEIPEQMEAAQNIRKKLKERVAQRYAQAKEHHETQAALGEDAETFTGISKIVSSVDNQRRVNNRLRLIWQHVSLPATTEAPKTIKESLAMVAMGLTTTSKDRSYLLSEGGLQLLHNKYTKIALTLGTGIAAAALVGEIHPEGLTGFVHDALGIGGKVLRGVIGWTRDVVSLAGNATTLTLEPFLNWELLREAYINGDRAGKFMMGVAAIYASGLAIIVLPIVTVNSWMTARDIHRLKLPGYLDNLYDGKGYVGAGISYVQDRTNAFIIRQQDQLASYLKTQTKSQEELTNRFGGTSETTFTPEQTKQVRQILTEITERDRSKLSEVLISAKAKSRRITSGIMDRVRSWRLFSRNKYDDPEHSIITTEDTETSNDPEHIAQARIHSFASAFKSFLVSYASIVDGFTATLRGWNGFTIFRRIFWSPKLWVIQTLYPNFANVALGDGTPGDLTVPTRINGGLDPLPLAVKRVAQFLTFSSKLDVIRAWEKKIIPVEKAIIKAAMTEGYRALLQFSADNKGELESLIKNGAVTSFSDPRLQELKAKHRVFYMRYVEALTALSIQRFLTNVYKQNGDPDLITEENAEEIDLLELKRRTLTQAEALQIDSKTATSLVAEAVRDGKALEDAKLSAKRFSVGNALKKLRMGALRIIDPKNTATFKRIQVVLEMLQKPDSMPRAVRATLSSLIMGKVIGVAMMLVALAGQNGSILQPFYPDQMFGPDSFFYLSRYVFVNGLLLGLATSMFSSPWIKLQADAKHSVHFGAVPNGLDAQKGYFSWYLKQTFKNKENSWWNNQKTYLQIIWGNMKPAFVLMLAMNLAGLGRFDMDGYFIGYVIAFAGPNSGFNMQLEQGSEFASYYPLKDFPEDLRGHPLTQEYLAKKQQRYRIYFSIWEKTFVDLQETIIGSFMRMGSVLRGVAYRNEALTRMMLGGYTPTEILYSGAEWAKDKTGGIPIVGSAVAGVANFCERIVTNNYTAWDKVRPPGFEPPVDGPKLGGH